MNDRRLLIIEDDPALSRQMCCALGDFGVSVAGNAADAERLLRRLQPQVVVLDLGLPADATGATVGLNLLATIGTLLPRTKVIVLTELHQRQPLLDAVAGGAYDFCQKPVDPATLQSVVERAFRFWELEHELRQVTRSGSVMPMDGLIAASDAMMDTIRQAERVAGSEATLLIYGESGTGRKLLAGRMHARSRRGCGPFITVACRAVEEAVLERELFGGVGPGETHQPGHIEDAHGGTLLLEEVGDLPLRLQIKLLRLLEEGKIEPAGGTRTIQVDVRIIATVSMDLDVLVDARRFHKDLAFRLAELVLTVPPLRERGEDAVLIARHLIDHHGAGRRSGLSKDCIAAIENWHWPGNVQELENRIKRGCVVAQGRFLVPRDIGFEDAVDDMPINLREARARAEREAAVRALQRSNGNVSQAARLLGISRPTLYNLISRHGLLAEANDG